MNPAPAALLAAALLATACAGGPSADYPAYLSAVREARPEPEPLVDIRFSETGQILALTVSMPPEEPTIQPFRPTHHPAWSILADAVRIGVPYLGGAVWTHASGRAFERVLSAVPASADGPVITNTTTNATTDRSDRSVVATRTETASADHIAGGDIRRDSPETAVAVDRSDHSDRSSSTETRSRTVTDNSSAIDADVRIGPGAFSTFPNPIPEAQP